MEEAKNTGLRFFGTVAVIGLLQIVDARILATVGAGLIITAIWALKTK